MLRILKHGINLKKIKMTIKIIPAAFLFFGLTFANPGFVIAESEGQEAGETETESSAGESSGNEATEGGASGAEAGAGSDAAAGTAAGSLVPAEVQQQVDSAQKTVDTATKTVQSVKEKGLVQTIWDNITAPFAALFQQIGQILGQIMSFFGGK